MVYSYNHKLILFLVCQQVKITKSVSWKVS